MVHPSHIGVVVDLEELGQQLAVNLVLRHQGV